MKATTPATKPDWSAYANQPVRSSNPKIVPQLRQHLQSCLPAYMVPATFVLLDDLPLTPNGKVDRKALPEPPSQRESSSGFIDPKTAEEKLIAAMWQEVLSLDKVGAQDNFFDLGGHSLLAAELLFRLKEEFEIDLALINVFMSPTVAGQAQLVRDRKSGTSLDPVQLDLRAEAVLAPDIVPKAANPSDITAQVNAPAAVLLTGATGFLGAFLLHELLQQTQATVYCLVRAKTTLDAKERIIANLQRYNLWQAHGEASIEARVVPIVGDLAQPMLGVSFKQFEQLAKTVDIIYHNGGMVNFMYPYSVMKATNVSSTETLLRLACQDKIKPVHFVSTMGVFSPIAYSDRPVIQADDDAERPEGLYGYTQSKWVAEKLLAIAQSRGIPTTIHRPAWVEGHSQTGLSNQSDFLRSVIKGCLQLGIAPDWQMPIDFVPVDYLSKAIVQLSRQTSSIGQSYNFANPHTISWTQLVAWLNDYGYALKTIPYTDWLERVKEEITPNCENALSPYLSFLTEPSIEYSLTVPEMYFQTHQLQFENENVLRGLDELEEPYPAIDDLLPLYFSYFIKTGYLSSPDNVDNQKDIV